METFYEVCFLLSFSLFLWQSVSDDRQSVVSECRMKGTEMSKYLPLWNWIRVHGTESFTLTFAEIEQITGFPIDHSFLNAKKELLHYGYRVGKISMKKQMMHVYWL